MARREIPEGEMLGNVFISHVAADKPFVQRLTATLTGNGATIWLDDIDEAMGDALTRITVQALSRSRVVIVVLSATYVRSEQMRDRLTMVRAQSMRGATRLVPVLMDDVESHRELEGLRCADCQRQTRRCLRDVIALARGDAPARRRRLGRRQVGLLRRDRSRLTAGTHQQAD